MNRIIIIGNGFDLAHGLKTSYANFIDWYWEKRIKDLKNEHTNESDDGLCKLVMKYFGSWSDYYKSAITFKRLKDIDILNNIRKDRNQFDISYSSKLFENINKFVENKGWVDIENEYYCFLANKIEPQKLNKELDIIKENLVEYLNGINEEGFSKIGNMKKNFYSPIKYSDFSVESKNNIVHEILKSRLKAGDKYWENLLSSYGKMCNKKDLLEIRNGNLNYLLKIDSDTKNKNFPELFLPDMTMVLNFNYTNIADQYFSEASSRFSVNHIHGTLDKPESIIFGYGDEKDETFKDLQKRNDKESLKNIKSIKYLEAPNYRKLLAFMESSPYQIFIIGHSCGQSDGTLLNTLFEHKNCISIKPFYRLKDDGTDNYMELVQNISRNFTDMKLMRDRVVNKTQCEPLPRAE